MSIVDTSQSQWILTCETPGCTFQSGDLTRMQQHVMSDHYVALESLANARREIVNTLPLQREYIWWVSPRIAYRAKELVRIPDPLGDGYLSVE